jgi:hypothetical protein
MKISIAKLKKALSVEGVTKNGDQNIVWTTAVSTDARSTKRFLKKAVWVRAVATKLA